MSNITTTTKTDFSSEQVALIKRSLLDTDKVKFTTDELSLFIHQAKRTGLDPFTRQIYATKRQDKMTVQATIDGLRLIAERSEKYEGQTKAEWCGQDGVWKDVWLAKTAPVAARIGVFKKGFREATYATALFEEYAQKDYNGKIGYMWQKMPALMIAKVAEALALRKAFPNDLSGIYSTEEMAQSDLPETVQTPVSEPKDVTNQPQEPGDYVVTFGKFKGMQLKDLKVEEIESYISYLENGSAATNRPLTGGPLAFVIEGKRFLEEVPDAQINSNDEINF